jgi:hypothetical protein
MKRRGSHPRRIFLRAEHGRSVTNHARPVSVSVEASIPHIKRATLTHPARENSAFSWELEARILIGLNQPSRLSGRNRPADPA